MAELKTKPNNKSVEEFLNNVDNETRKADGFALLEIFKEVTKLEPQMWGESIVGFGKYHYESERSSQKGDWPLVAFSPRKQNLSLYVLTGPDSYADLLQKLGKHKSSVGCLYVNKLADIDLEVLKQIIKQCLADMRKLHKVID